MHPLLAVATALRTHGHHVALLTATAYRAAVEAAGVTYFPPVQAPDRDYNRLNESFPTLRRLPNAEVLAQLFWGIALQDAPSQGHDVVTAAAVWQPDVLINDGIALGVPLAAGLLRLPWATVSPFLFCTVPTPEVPPPFLAIPFASAGKGRLAAGLLNKAADLRLEGESHHWRALAHAWQVPWPPASARSAGASPLLYVYPGGPPLEYPRLLWPPHVHGVGPLLVAQGEAVPLPRSPYPRLFLTEGTTHTDRCLARLAIRALRDLPLELVIALGERGDERELGPLPANVRTLGYVNYRSALTGAALLITNGGAGSLATALATGVPALILPAGLDKGEAAQRLAWSGAGLRLPPPSRCSPERFRRAVLTLIERSDHRERAAAVGRALAALGGATRAAELLGALGPAQWS